MERQDTEIVRICDEIFVALSEQRSNTVIRDKVQRIRKIADVKDARTGKNEKDR